MLNFMELTPEKGIIIAFGELFLKSEGVQNIFKKILAQNIAFFLGKEKVNFKIQNFRQRIFVQTGQTAKALKVLKNISGISWLAECLFFPKADLKQISQFISANYKDWIKKDDTFAIRLKLDKGVIKEGRDRAIIELAENIDRKVNLSRPSREIFVEIRSFGCLIYFRKIKGASGHPAGSEGKVLALMSGGIDSPVAAFLIARRGAENVWLHFHSFPLVSNKSIEKIRETAKVFLKYQRKIKVYFVPFSPLQMEIKTKAPEKERILLYRRLMFKIAEIIAEKENCYALVTGESLGQVSSQTLPNLAIIEDAVKIPALRPLIAQDKEEIIRTAEKIGTFDISIKPQEDCCTLFTPKHPTAHGDLKKIKDSEKKLNLKKLIQKTVKQAKVEYF